MRVHWGALNKDKLAIWTVGQLEASSTKQVSEAGKKERKKEGLVCSSCSSSDLRVVWGRAGVGINSPWCTPLT